MVFLVDWWPVLFPFLALVRAIPCADFPVHRLTRYRFTSNSPLGEKKLTLYINIFSLFKKKFKPASARPSCVLAAL